MKINILTLFPQMFECILSQSIIGKAIEKKIIDIDIINFRDFSNNKHKKVDDYPYGGGNGMLIKCQPIFKALNSIAEKDNSKIIYLSPKGKTFNHEMALELSKEKNITIICGHYEGIDQRIIDNWVTDEISIGDYVLTGGEIPAMVLIDSISRLVPGVLNKDESYKKDSFYNSLLEYPQYTRPANYEGLKVPQILLSGNHKIIEKWRLKKSLEITLERRPDLINRLYSSDMPFEEKKLIKEIIIDIIKNT